MQVIYREKEKKRITHVGQLLSDFIDDGAVISIRQLSTSSRRAIYRIVVSPTADMRFESRIIKKLAENGYRTSVSRRVQMREDRLLSSKMSHIFREEKYGTIAYGERYSVIIAKANVNYPKPPNRPGGLPDPDGKKSKGRK